MEKYKEGSGKDDAAKENEWKKAEQLEKHAEGKRNARRKEDSTGEAVHDRKRKTVAKK